MRPIDCKISVLGNDSANRKLEKPICATLDNKVKKLTSDKPRKVKISSFDRDLTHESI